MVNVVIKQNSEKSLVSNADTHLAGMLLSKLT